MSRSRTAALLAAFLIAGTALGQAPVAPPQPPAGVPLPTEPFPADPAPPLPHPDAPFQNVGVWATVDYTLGWLRGDLLPILITTSTPGTPRTAAGVLGRPNTHIVFGGNDVNDEGRNGMNLNLGYWFDEGHQWGIETGFFLMEGSSKPFFASSNGSQILSIIARPYTDTTTGRPASALVAFPGVSSGTVAVNAESHEFFSGNIDMRENICTSSWCRIDALLGYRYIRYDEALTIQQSLQPLGSAFVPGTTIQSFDRFAVRNIFNGVDLGVRGEFWYDCFTLDLLAKVAPGYITHNVNIAGSQQVSVPGFPTTVSPGGLLALASNSGAHALHTWTDVPEAGISLGWQVTSWLRLRAGYNALWIQNAERAGQQVDLNVNPTLIPPSNIVPTAGTHPVLLTQSTTLWVQTISFGVEFKY